MSLSRLNERLPRPTRREFLAGAAVTSVVLAKTPAAFAMGEAQHGASAPVQSVPGMLPPAEGFTRGVGVYPGQPRSYVGPRLVPAPAGTRNLALHKPAYHSSSYDYNLTAQCITDGIAATELPMWFACTSGERLLPKPEREILIDHHPANTLKMNGSHQVIELAVGGGTTMPEVDRVELFVVVPQGVAPATLKFAISTSEDGHTWQQQGTVSGDAPADASLYPPDLVQGNQLLAPKIAFAAPARARRYRVEMTATASPAHFRGYQPWQLGQVAFYRGTERVEIGGPYHFTSAWKSAGLDEEWVYVDLLDECAIESVKLHWIAPALQGKVQVSNDAHTWQDAGDVKGTLPAEEIRLASPGRARYVRVLMTQPATEHGYILSELEVMGSGGRVAAHEAAPVAGSGSELSLSRMPWRLQRDSLVQADGVALSKAGFADAEWLPATVPGTILTSYLNAGAIPDPNFGENQLYISDTFFYADFWYRTEFATPAASQQRKLLCLDGINWKAEVFLNGESIGRIDGAFFRGVFDVTGKLRPVGEKNALAILVRKNLNPGTVHQKTYENPSPNGGALGHDAPTFHASVGWDWIPTIRGRNTGIWNDVRLVSVPDVVVEDPLVQTKLNADHSVADVTVTVVMRNRSGKSVHGEVVGSLGDAKFSAACKVDANSEQVVTITSAKNPALRIRNPKLWWPNGYGEPYLYQASVGFTSHGSAAAEPLRFLAGLREITTSETDSRLKIFVNGRRLVAKGGNWGFSESMLRYRDREYDAAMRYHREMNFNLVRNWVGQIGEDAFYEACDRHGIIVWQDFWLANPWDGPIPDDNSMFLANGRDLVKRIRRHASVGIYCGRNEGDPPPALEAGIRKLLAELHPDLHYIPSSADHVVSGHGPYRTLSAIDYFSNPDNMLHSEIGAPNIPSLESVRAMMPERALWPQGLEYGLHDFTLEGAQGAQTLLSLIADEYGGATNGADWIELAQFLNYDTYRAMFEAQSRDRMGVLLWMSHPCWPSFVWQTYDYYFDCTAAYFACKKACEPIHIQWNQLTDAIEVVNYSAGSQDALQATAELLNPDGTSVWKKQAPVNAPDDSTTKVIAMEFPAALAAVHLLRLTLTKGDAVLSSNTYLRAKDSGNLRDVRRFAKANLRVSTQQQRQGEVWRLTTTVTNTSTVPSLLTRLEAVGAQDHQRILPAIFDDNYFVLMPNESRTITTELKHEDTRGQQPAIAVSGFNAHTA
ncbi:glycosyl hydrolase 2 galactose-binding domain-containing protein [Terriglobus aquaticus]|uniref:Glycosyl hydrolase 2 galactose-binding domain-containing protein n=1 Tax=Terriglobus aquaticus TaxID=940139 RepID=A0ABW9KEU4_9BACT|nr:discoidin domain-containing protein [Terriglobus aquaticus]